MEHYASAHASPGALETRENDPSLEGEGGTQARRKAGKQAFVAQDIAQARYAHGTRARYAFGHCRCFDCRCANTDYQRGRDEAHRKPFRVVAINGAGAHSKGLFVVMHADTHEIAFRGVRAAAYVECKRLNAPFKRETPNDLIATNAIRDHVRKLAIAGVGVQAIARTAPISRTVLTKMLDGRIKRTRRSTALRVLAVSPENALPDGAYIDAAPTWELLDKLIACGYPKCKIARWLGTKSKPPKLQIHRTKIRVSTARNVRLLFDTLAKRNPKLQTAKQRLDAYLTTMLDL